MPRNASGIYSLPAGNPVITGTTISSVWANSTVLDIGSELTNSLDRSGRGGMLAALLGVDGASGSPLYSFTSEPTTGIYKSAAGTISVTALGTIVGSFSAAGWSGKLVLPLGAVAAPSLAFTGDLTTGIWSPGAGSIAVSTVGVERYRANASGAHSYAVASAGNTLTAFVQGTAESVQTGFNAANTSSRIALGFEGTNIAALYYERATGEFGLGIATTAAAALTKRALWDSAGRMKILGGGSSAADVATTYSWANTTTYGLVDSSRAANNKEVEFIWSAGVLTGRFVNDAYNASTNWLTVTGGQAAGTTSISLLTGANVSTFNLNTVGAGFGPSSAAPVYGGQLFGAGQAAVSPTDAGAVGGTLMLFDTQGAANNGGLLAFGAFNSKGFAGIKGLLTDGASNSAGDLSFSNRRAAVDAGYTENLRLTAGGRLYGTAIHNNAGAVTGTVNQYIASGTYTPTLTNSVNISASTAAACQWMRVGNVVHVSGKFTATATGTASATLLGMTLPIASTFATDNLLGGMAGNTAGAGQVTAVCCLGDTTNNRCSYSWVSSSVASLPYTFTFTYLVV